MTFMRILGVTAHHFKKLAARCLMAGFGSYPPAKRDERTCGAAVTFIYSNANTHFLFSDQSASSSPCHGARCDATAAKRVLLQTGKHDLVSVRCLILLIRSEDHSADVALCHGCGVRSPSASSAYSTQASKQMRENVQHSQKKKKNVSRLQEAEVRLN